MSSASPHCRVVAHFDADCFYAQAEVLRRPHLKDRPVGITQKFLVVTCNYVARSLGVPKMASIDEAKRRCPEIVLLNGEDLTPYRAASKQILGVLGRFGVVEKLGLDEAAVDISAEVGNRLAAGANVQNFSGHTIGAAEGETCTGPSTMVSQSEQTPDIVLMLASHLVSEIRVAVERETGFCLSCGISDNKMLAKLACSVNKPNKQTTLLPAAVASFLFPLPVRKIPGVGQRTETLLHEMGAETVKDVQNLTHQQLSARLGDRVGTFLYSACRGCDLTPVRDKGHPKSLSVEDSFRMCTTMSAAEERLRSLAPDLVYRLDTDREETGRIPALFTLKWRYQESWKFTSLSARMPPDLCTKSAALEKRVEAAVEIAMRLLSKGLRGRPSYNLAVLNIGATSFEPETSGGLGSDIRLFLTNSGKSPRNDSPLVPSKRVARAQRELSEKRKAVHFNLPLVSAVEQDSNMERLRHFNLLAAAEEAEKKLLLVDADDGETSDDNYWEDIGSCVDAVRTASIPGDAPGGLNVCRRTKMDDDRTAATYSFDWKGNDNSKVAQVPACHGGVTSTSTVGEGNGRDQGDPWQVLSSGNDKQGGNDVPVPTPQMSQEAQTPTSTTSRNKKQGAHNVESSKTSTFCCAECQQEVRMSTAGRQEHEDYHFALRLAQQERLMQGSLTVARPSSAGNEKNRREGGDVSTPKKAKLRNATLDSFVIQYHHKQHRK